MWCPSTPIFQELRDSPAYELWRNLYYAVNVLTTVNCLDEEKSDILYATNDPSRILSISRYHVRDDVIPSGVSIFKIPQHPGVVFGTRTFVDCVRANQLRGDMLFDPTVGRFEGLIRPELNLVPDLPSAEAEEQMKGILLAANPLNYV